jgi:hypothetical protein
MFAQAIDALVAERDRVFIERVCNDYNLDFKELSAKYLEAAESAIKVPRKYKKREPKSVTVTADGEAPVEPKAKPPKEAKAKQCCTAHTSKKEACKFNALKGEVFCKRHLKQSLTEAEPKAPKEPKVKKAKKVEKPLEPVHTHDPDAEVHDDCDLCQTHGNAMSADSEEFEMVAAVPEVSVPVKLTSVQERLAALLAESDAEESDSDCSEVLGEECYEDE